LMDIGPPFRPGRLNDTGVFLQVSRRMPAYALGEPPLTSQIGNELAREHQHRVDRPATGPVRTRRTTAQVAVIQPAIHTHRRVLSPAWHTPAGHSSGTAPGPGGRAALLCRARPALPRAGAGSCRRPAR